MLHPDVIEKLQRVGEYLDFYDQLFLEPEPIITYSDSTNTTPYRYEHGESWIYSACQKCVDIPKLTTDNR